MATTDLAIVLRAFTGQFEAGMATAAASVKTFAAESEARLTAVGVASDKLQKSFTGLFGALVGGAIIDGLYQMAKHASEVDAKFAVMAQTAKAMNETFNAPEARQWIEGLATSVQGGGESIDTLAQGYTRFNVVLKDQAASQQAVQTALAVSAATGLDFNAVMSAMVKAAQGTNTGLSRLGVGLNAAKLKTMDFKQEIDYLNNFSLGALEKKGQSLAVQQAILASQFQIVSDTIGERLIPVFERVIQFVSGLIAGWDSLSGPAQTLIENVAGITLGATALGLILTPLFSVFGALGGVIGTTSKFLGGLFIATGAVAKASGDAAVATAAEGAAAGAATGPVADLGAVEEATAIATRARWAASGLATEADLVAGPAAARAAAGVATTGTAAAAASTAMVTFAGILAAIPLAIALLIPWFKNLSDHADYFYEQDKRLGGAFQDVWNGIVQVMETDGKVVLDMLLAMGNAMVGNWGNAKDAALTALADIKAGLSKSSVDFGMAGHAFAAFAKIGFDDAVTSAKATWAYIQSIFAGAASGGKKKPDTLPPPIYTDNTPAGKGAAAAAAAAAKSAVQAAIDATSAALDQYKRATEAATAKFDIAKAKLDTFRASLPGGKAQTPAEAAEEEKLMKVALDAQLAVRSSVSAQIAVALQAQTRELEAAKELVNSHLKNRLALMRQITQEAQKHGDLAQSLMVTYANMGAGIATAQGSAKTPGIDAQAFAAAQTAFAAKMADIVAQTDFRKRGEDIRSAEATARTSGKETPAMQAEFATARAQLAEDVAAYNRVLAQGIVDFQTHAAPGTVTDAETIAAAEALAQAKSAETVASHTLTDAKNAETRAINEAALSLGNAFHLAAQKIVSDLIPGLSMANDSFKLTFDWKTALLDAISHTRAYADIQRVAAAIMQVVAKMLDALRPVIDLMLKVLIGVVNVFIDVWNIFARIARLFGIQIPILQNLNENLASLNVQPLIDITHDIPTLNELASGKIGPLIPKGGAGDYNSPTVNAINTGSNGIIGILEKILAAIIAMALISKLFGGGGAGGLLSGLMGKGGIAGMLGGFGSGTILTTALSALGWGALAYGIFSLAKGLFGDHFAKKDEPDLFLPGYKAFLHQFNEGAASGLHSIEKFLATGGQSALTGQAAADAKRLQQLGGKSGNLGIASEHNDVFTLGSGAKVNVEDYIALVKRFAQEMGGAANGVANALLAGATAIRGNLGAAGNELAVAVRSSAHEWTRAITPATQALTSAVTVTANMYGNIHGVGDVRSIAGEIANSTVRAGKTNAWEMTRRAL